MYIKNKANKVYDENRYIYGFAQIKEYLESQGKGQLYDDLVSLSILQSGLRTSPISFTSLLPYEDFKNKYAETLSYINDFSNLDEFTNLDVFKRNNWNNSDIVPSMSASYIKGMYNPFMNHFLPKKAKAAIQDGKVPMLLQVSINSIDAKDVVSYSWEKGSTAEKKRMRKEKDYSYIKKGLFKKVYEDEAQTIPLIRTYINPKNGKPYLSYVYKMVNAWGQGIYANELYMEAKPSVFDNGYIKVEERTMTVNRRFPNGEIDPQSFIDIKFSPEVNDSEIVKLYPDDATVDISPVIEVPQITPTLSVESLLIKLGARKVSKGMLSIDGQHWYLDSKYWSTLPKPGGNELFIYPDSKNGDIEISVGFKKDGEKTFKSDLSSYDLEDTQAYLSKSTEQTDNWQEEDNTCTNPIV